MKKEKQNDYEKFMEGFNKKTYVSTTAEYKRTVKRTVKKNINAKEDVIFNAILSSALKNSDLKGDTFFFEGEKINTKDNTAYVYKFVENKKFSYIYKAKGKNEYFITTFEIEGTSRSYSIVSFTYETKIPHTVAGFNGKLGNMKFKKESTKLGKAVLEKLDRIVCGPKPDKKNKKK